jgi:hypothetical protein
VSSGEALVFLGGANLGAAAYEYGLARLTRVFLRREHASFDADWVPAEYLEDYYAVVEPDEHETIAYFADAIRQAAPGEPILFFGTGPTLHHVFLSADRASEIHLADYLPQNLAEIERWLERDADAHDWRPFVRYTLECKGVAAPTEEQLVQREELTRAKVTRLLQADAGDGEPVGERYGTVISAYCADSATADRTTWEAYTRHIAGLVEPGRRVHHRGAAAVALLPRRRQAIPERRRRRARPARGARARVRLRDPGPRGPRARPPGLLGHRPRVRAAARLNESSRPEGGLYLLLSADRPRTFSPLARVGALPLVRWVLHSKAGGRCEKAH